MNFLKNLRDLTAYETFNLEQVEHISGPSVVRAATINQQGTHCGVSLVL